MKCHGVRDASSIKGKRNKDHFKESYEAMETAEIADSRFFFCFILRLCDVVQCLFIFQRIFICKQYLKEEQHD